jgi:hypothetical protein
MIIKSDKYLGDTIHAYMIVKTIRDAGENASLITNEKYKILFDKKYLIDSNNIDFNFSSLSDCKKYLTNSSIHVRDDIAKSFTHHIPLSSPLTILPHKFNTKSVIICNRSSRRAKEWFGKWNNIIDYLSKDGYSIIFDTAGYDLHTIISYIAGANLVISVDNGLIHATEAYNVPLIGLYGDKLDRFHPYSKKEFCIEKPLSILTPTHIIDKIEELKWSDKYGLSDSIEGIT